MPLDVNQAIRDFFGPLSASKPAPASEEKRGDLIVRHNGKRGRICMTSRATAHEIAGVLRQMGIDAEVK